MKHLTATDIANLYNKFIVCNDNESYLNRYTPLPLERNTNSWRWENKDFPRVIATLEFENLVKKYSLKSNHLLSFNSYNDPELQFLSVDKVTNFNYSDNTTDYDLHTLNIPEDDYDFVMLNQTFEHLYNPYLCLENIHKYLKSGAYIYSNVPTVNIQHSLPYNYYTGYTPIGFVCLFESCGFEVLESGQWGNSEYIGKIFQTHQWPDYNNVNTKNEFNNPVQTWVLARKK